MMILVVFAHSGKLSHNRYVSTLQNLLVAKTGSLENWGCSTSTASNNNELASLDGLHGMCCQSNLGLKLRVRSVLNTHCALVVVEQYSNNLRLNKDMQIGVLSSLELRVDVFVGRVLALAIGRNISLPT
jgi:hypothetical protein